MFQVCGVRCAVCWNELSARLAKEHTNANMSAIGAHMVSRDEAIKIIDTWLNAKFEYGRHMRRIEKLEQGGEPAKPADPKNRAAA